MFFILKSSEKSRRAAEKSMRIIVFGAILSAISIVLGKYLSFTAGPFRISFENLSVLMAGIFFGPVFGMIVGGVADVVGSLLVGYAINPIITAGAILVGGVSGLAYKLLKPISKKAIRLYISVLMAHIVGSMIVKSIGLALYYGYPFKTIILRVPLYIVISFAEFYIIFLLIKNKAFMKYINETNFEKERKMNYSEAIEYIHSINWCTCKPGLERIKELCEKMGNPQNSLRFIHVGGTNGKGSFCAMTEKILQKAGYKTGMFTSPYVRHFNERIKYCGEDIKNKELSDIVEYIKPIAETMEEKPTEFELITAIGFEYFKRKKCDVVILEVGMGGRLDSTNIINTPCVSVITEIALDHTSFLGDTISKIAFEKAGIIKEGIPVVLGEVDSEAYGVIKKVADEKNSECSKVDYSALKVNEMSYKGSYFDYKENKNLYIKLLGEYQPRNAALVLECVEVLRKKGFKISDNDVKEGLASAIWHARFEVIKSDPVVIFDGGHNPNGIMSVNKSIQKYFPGKKVYILSGVMADKDYKKIISYISGVTKEVFTVRPDNPRALSAQDYAAEWEKQGVKASYGKDLGTTLKTAIEKSKKDGIPLICVGSLYMYSGIMDVIDKI